MEPRRARTEDVPALAGVLARAFEADPGTAWAWPPGRRRRERALRRFFAWRLRSLLPHDDVWTAGDLSGVAAWAPPGRWELGVGDSLGMLALAPSVGRRLPLVARGLAAIGEAHPVRPHAYLALLGTDPPRQGRGVASALLEPVLADCDALELPAYLETSTERNVDFYARHGFRVTGEVALPQGPTVWLMWREPAPRSAAGAPTRPAP